MIRCDIAAVPSCPGCPSLAAVLIDLQALDSAAVAAAEPSTWLPSRKRPLDATRGCGADRGP
ncbi:MAG: hypothetical protein NTY19_04570 [Planctomycetota bacterium]|nr:hypothetical protein [Planctomycetota bacterium]